MINVKMSYIKDCLISEICALFNAIFHNLMMVFILFNFVLISEICTLFIVGG